MTTSKLDPFEKVKRLAESPATDRMVCAYAVNDDGGMFPVTYGDIRAVVELVHEGRDLRGKLVQALASGGHWDEPRSLQIADGILREYLARATGLTDEVEKLAAERRLAFAHARAKQAAESLRRTKEET